MSGVVFDLAETLNLIWSVAADRSVEGLQDKARDLALRKQILRRTARQLTTSEKGSSRALADLMLDPAFLRFAVDPSDVEALSAINEQDLERVFSASHGNEVLQTLAEQVVSVVNSKAPIDERIKYHMLERIISDQGQTHSALQMLAEQSVISKQEVVSLLKQVLESSSEERMGRGGGHQVRSPAFTPDSFANTIGRAWPLSLYSADKTDGYESAPYLAFDSHLRPKLAEDQLGAVLYRIRAMMQARNEAGVVVTVDQYSDLLGAIVNEEHPPDDLVAVNNSRLRSIIDAAWAFDPVAEALVLAEVMNTPEVREWVRSAGDLASVYRGGCQYRRMGASGHKGQLYVDVYRHNDVLPRNRPVYFKIRIDPDLLGDRLLEDIRLNSALLSDLPEPVFWEFGMGPLIATLRGFIVHFGLDPDVALQWLSPLGWQMGPS